MIELSVIRDLVTIFGVIAGFSYYVLTVRNTNKARRKDILFQRLNIMDDEFYNNWRRIFGFRAEEWKTGRDFAKHVSENPEDYGFISSVLMLFQSIGTLLKDGVIDPDYVFDIYSPHMVIWTWEKLVPVVEMYREAINYPNYFSNFENLYNETCKKYPELRHMPEYRQVLQEFLSRNPTLENA